jgi:hypothetical protein
MVILIYFSFLAKGYVIVMTVDDVPITESTRWFPFGLTEKDIIIFIGIIFFFFHFLSHPRCKFHRLTAKNTKKEEDRDESAIAVHLIKGTA